MAPMKKRGKRKEEERRKTQKKRLFLEHDCLFFRSTIVFERTTKMSTIDVKNGAAGEDKRILASSMPHAGRVSFQYHTETYQLKQKYPND